MARNNVWPAPHSGRVLRNAFSDKWFGRERELLQQLHVEQARYQAARANYEYDTAAVIAGESAGLIHAVMPAKAIVMDVVKEMNDILGYSSCQQKHES